MSTTLGSLRQRRLFAACAAASFVTALSAGAQFAQAADHDPIPPEDAAVLAEPEVGGPTAAPTLTKEDALARARQIYGEDAMGATDVDAYLVSTARAWLGATDPMVDRPTWIVHLSGLGMVMPGPAEEEGTPVATHVVDDIHVFIAADTCEFLGSIWTE
jgi:hypothetical protein